MKKRLTNTRILLLFLIIYILSYVFYVQKDIYNFLETYKLNSIYKADLETKYINYNNIELNKKTLKDFKNRTSKKILDSTEFLSAIKELEEIIFKNELKKEVFFISNKELYKELDKELDVNKIYITIKITGGFNNNVNLINNISKNDYGFKINSLKISPSLNNNVQLDLILSLLTYEGLYNKELDKTYIKKETQEQEQEIKELKNLFFYEDQNYED